MGGSQRNYNSRDGDDDEDENDDETEEEEALDPSRRREDPLTRVSLKARLLTSTEHPAHRSHRRHYYYYCSQSNQSNRRVLLPLPQTV
ncbi:MAG: hypothetical protein ACK55I_40615 [bacterium]